MTTSGVVVGASWAAKKLLGPTLDAIGQGLASYYEFGANRILASAYRKTKDIDDGKAAICEWRMTFCRMARLRRSILAACLLHQEVAMVGKMTATPFVDVVKSLSSSQLRLHYNIWGVIS